MSFIFEFSSQVPERPGPQHSPEPEDDKFSKDELDAEFLQSLSAEIDALKEDARKILGQRMQLIQRRKALLEGQQEGHQDVPCS